MIKKPEWLHIKMPSGHKRMTRNVLLTVCAAFSLIFTGAFATYALLKTVTPTATNVFQSDKNIRITLDEPEWEDHGKSEAKAYVPGQKIDKDPTVTLEAGSVASYAALKVQYFDSSNNAVTREEFGNKYLNKDTSATQEDAGIDYSDKWEYIGTLSEEKADVYIYRDILKQDIKETAETENVTAPLFTRVYLDKGIEQDKETKRLPKFNIKITAYAIQADVITYDDAKTEMMEYVNNRSVEGL